MLKHISALVLFVGLGLFSQKANAALTFQLNQGECCASVNLDQNGSAVRVTVSLLNNEYFVNTGNGSNHPGFAFNLSGDPSVNINVVNGDFTVGSGSFTTSGPSFGTFDYYLNAPGNGASAKDQGPLVFDVSVVGSGSLSPNSFVANSNSYYFVADILGADGNTGLVAAKGPGIPSPAPVPEPASMVLFGSALAGCVLLLRRSHKYSEALAQ